VIGLLLGWAAPWRQVRGWRWAPAGAAALVSAAALLLAARLPTFTVAQPQALTFHHVAAGTAGSWWLANGWPLPPALASAARFDSEVDPLPWSKVDTGSVAVSPALGLASPELAGLQQGAGASGERWIRGRLRSRRAALTLQLVVPDGKRLRRVAVDGVEVPPDSLVRYGIHQQGYEVITLWSPPPGGHELEVSIVGEAPLAVELVDRTPGLPPAGRALLGARPAFAAPAGFGDSTVVRHRLDL
jgi:hypothetical protein